MAIVINPFHSVWASGSIGDTLTCKYQPNKKFVMSIHCNPWGKIGAIQKIWANEFKRKIALSRLMTENLDLAQRIIDIKLKDGD